MFVASGGRCTPVAELVVMTKLCGAPGRRGRMVEICCRPQIATTEGATLGRWRRDGEIFDAPLRNHGRRSRAAGQGEFLIRLDGGSPSGAGHASKDDFSLVSLF